MDAIFERRSIRKYQDKKVPDELIKTIIRAGMLAPSARNQQLCHFIIVDDKKLLESIVKIHPNGGTPLSESPVAIIVCGDLSLQKAEGFWIQDCSAATENMLIEAKHLGLGSLWIGIYPREERINGLKKLFSLPENVFPLSVVALGYPAETPPNKDNYDVNKIHHNRW